MPERFEVIVIGGGRAGLAAGYHDISSSLIDGVGDDAKYVVEAVAARRSRA